MKKVKGYFKSFYEYEGAQKWEKPLFVFSIIILIISLIPRIWAIDFLLPIYSIDENELVEFSASYFGGNKDPHWYRYGALYSYILYYVYQIQLFFSGTGEEQFIQKVFMDNESFYYTARVINSILNIAMAFIIYEIGKQIFNRKVALVAFCISLFPFADLLVAFTIRVDTLLAFCALVSLYYLIRLAKYPDTKYYVLAGLFWGLSIACKPIPALLIGPTVVLSVFLSYFFRDTSRKISLDYVVGSITNYKIYLVPLFAFLGNLLGNPYSIINWSAFVKETKAILKTEGSRNFIAGWDITRFFDQLGVLFTIASFLLLIIYLVWAIKNKKWYVLIPISYVVVYWLAFAFGAARDYFYVPIVGLLGLMIAKGLYDFIVYLNRKSIKISSSVLGIGLLTLLFVQPAFTIVNTVIYRSSLDPETEYSVLASKHWMEQNIKRDESLVMGGFYVNHPRVVLGNIGHYGPYFGKKMTGNMWGDYFMYGRAANEYWRTAFQKWHNTYLQSGEPRFDQVSYIKIPKIDQIMQLVFDNKASFLIASSPFNVDTNQFFKNLEIQRFMKGEEDIKHGPSIFFYKLDTKQPLNMICETPVTSIDHYLNAFIYQRSGKVDKAAQSLEKALAKNSNQLSALKMKAQLLTNKGDSKKALEVYNKILAIAPKDLNVINNVGIINYNNKSFDESIEAYTTLIELKPDYGDSYVMKARSLLAMKDTNQALKVLNQGKKAAPKTENIYLLKASIFEKKGERKKAAANYRETYLRNEKNQQAIQQAYNIDASLEDYPNMLKDINAFLKVQPKNGQLYLVRAQIHQKLDQKNQACADFKKAATEFGITQAKQMANSYCQ